MICNCEQNMPQSELRLVRGNDFTTLYQLTAKYADGTIVEDFDIQACTEVRVLARRNNKGLTSSKDISAYGTYTLSTNNTLRIDWDGLLMKLGTYTVDFAAKYDGVDIRCYSSTELVFDIVETNEEANIPAGTFIDDGTYMIDGDFVLLFGVQERADWEQTDPNEPSYIKNKPDLNVYVEKEEGKGLSENDYSDEEKQKVADAVPNTREINGKALDSDITLTSSDIGALPISTKYGYSIGLSLNNQDYKLTVSLKDQDGTILNSKVVDFPLETVVVSGRYDPTNRAIVLTLQNGNSIDVPVGDLVNGLQSQITSSNKLSADLVDDTNAVHKFVSASEKTAWDAKQAALVSGTNIKTINNESLLGSGNINTQGGGGSGAIDSISVNGTPQTIDENKNVDITMPTKVSDLDNDSGFITGYTETDPVFVASAAHGINSSDISNWNAKGTYSKPSGGIPSTDMTEAVQTSLGKADTALQSFTETDPTVPSWAKASSKPSYTASEVGAVPTTRTVNGKALSADITLSASDVNALPSSTVIPDAQIQSDWAQADNTKKDYIKNKPTIPTVPTISTDISSDATSDTKTASPKAVKTYADSVAGDTNVIEGIKMNNTSLSPDANKVIDLGTVITSHQDISGKADKSEMSVSTSSDQTTITLKSGTSATVINSHQSLSGKQDTLVSGTNIKTINGSSILGSGNLSTFTPVNNHGTSDTTYTLPPNQLHIWGTVASLAISFGTPTDATIVNEYMIEFVSGSTPTTLSLPSSVEWAESCGSLSVEASKTYQISIVNNIGLWASISNS